LVCFGFGNRPEIQRQGEEVQREKQQRLGKLIGTEFKGYPFIGYPFIGVGEHRPLRQVEDVLRLDAYERSAPACERWFAEAVQ
jgi:hypothetical protein